MDGDQWEEGGEGEKGRRGEGASRIVIGRRGVVSVETHCGASQTVQVRLHPFRMREKVNEDSTPKPTPTPKANSQKPNANSLKP